MMSATNNFHHMAMDFAALASMERARGNVRNATDLFEQALENEIAAIDALDGYVEPTYSVLHRSAATLALDCRKYREAERLAAKALAEAPPEEIAGELRDVLNRANSERNYWDYPASSTVRLTFDGGPVTGKQGITADFCTKAVAAFEKAVASVGASQDGHLAWMGPIPNRDAYSLSVTSIAYGSFGFELEAASPRGKEISSRNSQVASAVEMIIRVLEESLETADDDELADFLGDFNRRAIKDVYQFLELVAQKEAVCSLTVGDNEIRFQDTEHVRRSVKRLGRVEIEEMVELSGRFRGFMPNSRRVEFLVDDPREVITGVARTPVIEFAERNLNRTVRTTARKRQMGTARPHYTFLETMEW